MILSGPKSTAQRLAWRDYSLGVIALANGKRMRLTLGLGSGLSQRAGDPKGTIWAIADRGPNLKIKPAIDRYDLAHLKQLKKVDGAKIMPRPDIGPTICQLRLNGDRVHLIRRIPLRGMSGRAISGLPIPAGAADVEPAFDLKGEALGSDPSGADTEAIIALSDGSFWVGDEFGPSLLHVGPDGQVLQRWVPKGLEKTLKGADYDVKGVLPALALRRRSRPRARLRTSHSGAVQTTALSLASLVQRVGTPGSNTRERCGWDTNATRRTFGELSVQGHACLPKHPW